MVHYTCDLCGKDLNAECDSRYIVRIEAYPGFDPNRLTESDLEDDTMEAVADLIRHDEEGCLGMTDPTLTKVFRFDLCPCCHNKFLKDPLSKDSLRVFDFSKN